MTRSMGLVAAALATAALAFVFTLGSAEVEATARPDDATALPVETTVLERVRGYELRETHAGRIQSRRASALGFERPGRLDRVLVDEGDRVEAGALLAALDVRQLRASRREAEAQIGAIEAELRMASLTTARRRALRETDHVSPEQLDQAVAAEAALAARLAAAKAALENVDAALALSEIRAPYAGSITAREADEGTIVSPGVPVLRLIEDGALELRVGLPPELAADLAVGSRHEIELETKRVSAVLAALVDAVEDDTRTRTAIFRVDPGDDLPADGTIARISLPRRIETEGFWLPLAALAESHRGLWAAYVVSDAGSYATVERRQVEVLHVDASRAFVRGTLADGERIVSSGVHRLVPGQHVAPVSSTPAAAAPTTDPSR